MSPSSQRHVFVETFGCQMNKLDSELVAGQLRGLGYRFTDRREIADVILYNTCSVRQQAEDKVHGRVGDAKALKRERPNLVLGVIGCMAERDGAALLEKYPQIDLICGPGELDKIPVLIDNAVRTRQPQTALQGHQARRSSTLAAAADNLEMLDLSRSVSPTDHNGSAYVRITRGCNKFCSYCVVPFTRGPEVHRSPERILEECRRLADAGVIEVTLLGQTVNHYRFDHGAAVRLAGVEQPQVGPGGAAFRDPDHRLNTGRRITTFADLLHLLHEQVPQIRRLRFVTSYPRDFGDDILQVMARSPRICRYLHVPAQHGSDVVLRRMNRDYTAGAYIEFVDRVRDHLPDAMLASDFIVGFPGETDADFAATCDLLRRCRFKNSFIFKYSPRPGTVAIDKFEDDVPESVKKRRNVELLAIQSQVSQEIADEQVGRRVEVLVEGASPHARKQRRQVELGWDREEEVDSQLSGRTGGDLIVMFQGSEELVGQIVPVRIQSAQPLTLFGEMIAVPATAGG